MIKKAGTILINKRKIGLVYRSNHDDYSFPKGHQEEGETSLECAIRETNEETKREVTLLMEEPLYVEYYTDSKNNFCNCVYYLVRDNGVILEYYELVLRYDNNGNFKYLKITTNDLLTDEDYGNYSDKELQEMLEKQCKNGEELEFEEDGRIKPVTPTN